MSQTMPSVDQSQLQLSVVVPVFNEQEIIAQAYKRFCAAMEMLAPMRWELVFVNDGSSDNTLQELQHIATDRRVCVIDLSRNFGHQIATTAGLDHARGDAVVIMDGDLQDPPEVIIQMVEKWRQGYQVVYGVRRSRAGESAFKRATAALFYRVLGRLSDTKIPLDTGDFRLLDRKVVNALNSLREESRLLRGLVSWVGFRQCPISYDRDPRFAGKTKYPLARMLKLAFDGISGFSNAPLRLAGHLGLVVTGCSLLLMIWVVIGRFLRPHEQIQGWSSVVVIMLFLGGVQLASIGILGEYIGRIFRQSKSRPLYFVQDRINIDQPLDVRPGEDRK